ncbi:hypothetical protein CTAYLR_009128 [Chrysophaeum taylorii]|uniref:aldehyde dehydrogenase (NAD(+)) n=1 Tax=Chrysophaeum taylorii TaxID=2483200 RepID=A0AAD7UM37_9STRA|nr:hypothetical protein CTAYLR_009128 [Chrysophaeum taylorii]
MFVVVGLGVVRVCRRRWSSSSGRAATLYVDGEVRGASDGLEIDVVSPADESVMSRLSDASAFDAGVAICAARRAFETKDREWARIPSQRSEALLAASAWTRANVEELADLESRDCGKPIIESRVDVAYCGDVLEYYAGLATSEDTMLEGTEIEGTACAARVRYGPRGACALVTPWNFPLMQAVLKVAPCVAAGNTFVLKPSPLASLTCVRFVAEALGPACPPGVANLLTGGPPLSAVDRASAALVSSPEIDFASFTGSTRGGRAVLAASAPHARPSALELGGKGACVVFDDVDLDVAADWVMFGIFQCAGQVCSATSRLLAHRDIYRPLLDRICEKTVEKVVPGHPLDARTTLGPVVSRDRASAILAAVDRAPHPPLLRHGDNKFSYVAAHVFDDVPVDSELWRDEIFGPVLATRAFDTEDDAVALANDSLYGLAHTVLTADQSRADRVATKLDAGVVWCNANQLLWPQTPFGGTKRSGFGWEGGLAGLREYQQPKTVIQAPPGFSFRAYS